MDRIVESGVRSSVRRPVKLSLNALGDALLSVRDDAAQPQPLGTELTKDALLALTRAIVSGRKVDLSSPNRTRAQRPPKPSGPRVPPRQRPSPQPPAVDIPAVFTESIRSKDRAGTKYEVAAEHVRQRARQTGLPDIRTESAQLGRRDPKPSIIIRGSGGEGLAQITLGGDTREVFMAVERTLQKEAARWREQMVSSVDYDSPVLRIGDRVGHKWQWTNDAANLEVIDIRGTIGRKAAKIRKGGHYEVVPIYALYKASS